MAAYNPPAHADRCGSMTGGAAAVDRRLSVGGVLCHVHTASASDRAVMDRGGALLMRPDAARSQEAAPLPSSSAVADPSPSARRAGSAPRRSSGVPSPQTLSEKSSASVISNWQTGDNLIGRLHSGVGYGPVPNRVGSA